MSGEFDDLKRRMDGAIAAFRHDLASLRTGRASGNLLDAIQVQAYGTTMSNFPLSPHRSSDLAYASTAPSAVIWPS